MPNDRHDGLTCGLSILHILDPGQHQTGGWIAPSGQSVIAMCATPHLPRVAFHHPANCQNRTQKPVTPKDRHDGLTGGLSILHIPITDNTKPEDG